MACKFNKTYAYVDETGKSCSIRLFGSSQQETDKKFQEFIVKEFAKPAETLKVDDITLREYVETIYVPTYLQNLAATTRVNYDNYLKLYILPVLGEKMLSEIRLEDIQLLNNWMAEAKDHGRSQNLNRKTIERVDGFLGRILKIATASGRIEKNPYCKDLLRNNGEMDHHHEALPDEEADRIKKAIPLLTNERERLYMALLVFSSGGMRREEILGLKWEDVDLKEGIAMIHQVVTYGEGKGTVIKNEPKTKASKRVVMLPKVLCAILKESQQASGYVVHGKDISVPVSNATLKRLTSSAFSKLGMKGKYTSHDWRATQATSLVESGMSSKMAADLLGHADARMIETVYAPARKAGILKNRDIVEKMNEAYAV